MVSAALAVIILFVASDAVIALVAQLLVPNNDPVILPDTLSEPVTVSPLGKFTNPSNDCA